MLRCSTVYKGKGYTRSFDSIYTPQEVAKEYVQSLNLPMKSGDTILVRVSEGDQIWYLPITYYTYFQCGILFQTTTETAISTIEG